jgi:PleD family two-component response regulator
MSAGRRVLIVANSTRQKEIEDLFTREPLDSWSALFADSFSQARCTLQHNACDLLVVLEEMMHQEGAAGLSWIIWQQTFPVLVLGDSPENFSRAYELGVTHCLARDMAMSHPPLMALSLDHARHVFEIKRSLARTKEQLGHARRHIDRLVTLMWRTTPRHSDGLWYSQPYMMERLQEELARAERHKAPLSLALGEIKTADEPEQGVLPDWSTELIVREKRRSDVAGHYGPKNFMILMVQTPKTGGITCCKRLQQVIEHPAHEMPAPAHSLQAFFGLATTTGDRTQPQALLRAAEQNLESARQQPVQRIVAD